MTRHNPPTELPSDKPVSIYEVELDSWMRVPEEGNRPLRSAEIAPKLAAYARRMNFTRVELLSAAPAGRPEWASLIGYLRQHELEAAIEPVVSSAKDKDWDTAWANEILDYFSNDPLYRKFQHRRITFQDGGAFSGDLILPLSHELVAPGKKSLIERMPGDEWQKFANMRLLFAYMYALPGKKLIFMGAEFGQLKPWNPAGSLDWHLIADDNSHAQLQHWVADLNYLYRNEPALYQKGFEWVESSDSEMSTLVLLRRGTANNDVILAAFNFTPVPRLNYRVGVPAGGFWKESLNSDAREYGGSGHGNFGGVEAAPFGWHYRSHSLQIMLPPLGAVFFKRSTQP